MAKTLGTFTEQKDGSFQGTIKTLLGPAPLHILRTEKGSDKAPDFRVYAGQRSEIGAGWSRQSKKTGETYVRVQIATIEFAPNDVYFSLVKLTQPGDDGATHVLLPDQPKEPTN